MFPAVLLLAGALTALALLSGGSEAGEPHEEDSDVEYGPPTTGNEVATAFVEQLVSQSAPRNRDRLEKLLREQLTTVVDDTTTVVSVPCDIRGTLSCDQICELARALGEAYQVKILVERISVGRYPFASVSFGPHPTTPDLSHLDQVRTSRDEVYGGLVDLIVNTVVASAVGTVTSMGVQDLVHSMGGERRLARIMRHYRNAEARGDEAAMARIQNRVTRSASRIKGRRVDWSEVEALASR